MNLLRNLGGITEETLEHLGEIPGRNTVGIYVAILGEFSGRIPTEFFENNLGEIFAYYYFSFRNQRFSLSFAFFSIHVM